MSDLPMMTIDDLQRGVAGDAAAIRAAVRLQPAGGVGDKIFPPTYATGGGKIKYAMEERRVDGQNVQTVLLDSVASQANRMEEALLEAWESGDLEFPVITVDFTEEEGINDLDRLTSLQAPHRIADALLRDSITEDGLLFRDTDVGKAFTASSPKNATAVFAYCPTALVFGVWDSTGPRGGLGTKFQRALVSEIVGFGAVTGIKTASRIDPAGIQANVNVYHRKDHHDDWTIREDEAQVKSGKPVPFSRKGSEGKGKPSAVNHSNVAPTVDDLAGGVTIDYALQTTVLSMPALRRLRFVADTQGSKLTDNRREAENAARTAVAALALAAVAFQRARGYDLRSRSMLVPDPGGPLALEMIPAEGGDPVRRGLNSATAKILLSEAARRAADAGFTWSREPIRLRPAPKLADLIRQSRLLAARGEGEEVLEDRS